MWICMLLNTRASTGISWLQLQLSQLSLSAFHFHFGLKRLEEVYWRTRRGQTSNEPSSFAFGSTFRRSILESESGKVEALNRFVCRLVPALGAKRAHFKQAPSGNSLRRERKSFWLSTFIRYCHSDCGMFLC